MNTFLKILAGVAVAGASLCTAGVLPASIGIIFTCVGTLAAALHPSVAAVQAFGTSAK